MAIDNFSAQAKAYARFRPHYPDEMIRFIVSQCSGDETALDVATGNGQVAVALSAHFHRVFATDISAKQLENATRPDNVEYRMEPAESTSFEDRQFDLVTVAQAIHWFDFDQFYSEVYRILKPNGIVAVMGYGLLKTNPGTDIILDYFYNSVVGPYWDRQRRYIDEEYRTIPFPFDEIEAPGFENGFTWTFEELKGYLETWSAVQHYIKAKHNNPVSIVADALAASWERSDKRVRFPLLLRLGKLKKQQ
jgi:ubiquinone/menaquinone biosynthesis C-methylase UbiE